MPGETATIPIFHCPKCAKVYAWKRQSAGKTRVCACGEFVPIPMEPPTGSAPPPAPSRPAPSAATQQATQARQPLPYVSPPVEAPVSSKPVPAASAQVAVASASQTPAAQRPEGDTYDVAGTDRPKQKSMSKTIDDDASEHLREEHVSSALIADVSRRRFRHDLAEGSTAREWIGPCIFILAGSIIDAIAIHRHLSANIPGSLNLGRALALYLMVNAIGLAVGSLLARALLQVTFGRFATSAVKWLAIAVATPAIWAAIVQVFVQYHIGGTSAEAMGIFVGWAIESFACYAMFSIFFDVEPLDKVWTATSINSVKVALFLSWYLLKPNFGAL